MYSILFHICGVILLEGGFFFYYIGPIETKMFKTKLLKLTKEPIEYINNKNKMLTPMEKEVLKNVLFSENTIEENYNEIYQKSKLGEEYRYNQNMLLLREMIKYWCVLFAISILTYLIYYYYVNLYKKKDTIIEYHSPRKLQLNEIENGTYYRKNSLDDDDVGLIENNNNNNNNIIINFCTKKAKIISYLLFAFLLILFQYLFFQYIVFQYNPLTIDEVKYILYNELMPVLDEYSNNTDSIYIPIPLSTLPHL